MGKHYERSHVRLFSIPFTPACPAFTFASSSFSFAVSAADFRQMEEVAMRREGLDRRVVVERRAAGRRRNDMFVLLFVGDGVGKRMRDRERSSRSKDCSKSSIQR